MTLPEAIISGARKRPQAFGGIFDARTGGSDPFGAALDAVIGFQVPDDLSEDRYLRMLATRFPEILNGGERVCPACGRTSTTADALAVIAIHLNDDHRWSREEIARFVEGSRGRLGSQ